MFPLAFALNRLRLPFDAKTPGGYAIHFLVQAATYIIIANTVFCAIGMAIGAGGMLISLGQNITRKFGTLNKNYNIDRNATKLKQTLCETMQFHAKTKQSRHLKMFVVNFELLILIYCFRVINQMTKVIEYHITAYFIWSVLAICDSMLLCQVSPIANLTYLI